MLTTILIVALALIAFAYVALPLLLPKQADPLPDDRDPVLADLSEERDALYRAIRELESRTDLPLARSDTLRQRYEAKAARTVRAIAEREAELAGRPARPAPRPRRRPVAALALLGAMIVVAALLPSFILPRVGQDATITTTDLALATNLRDLQQAAARAPTADNLLALGDAYIGLGQVADAEAQYRQVVATVTPVPAGAYQRLAMIDLSRDLAASHDWLRLARQAGPGDANTLYLLGEVAYARGELTEALGAFEELLVIEPDFDPTATRRLELLRVVAPLSQSLSTAPTRDDLMAFADAFWQAGERERAVEAYFRVLSEHDPLDAIALGRTGQLLLLAGRAADAAAVIERAVGAVGLAGLEPDTMLSLGNAYLQSGQFEAAAAAYRAYIAAVGVGAAGNAPSLLASAEARSRGEEDPGDAAGQILGQQVFATNCASCHGAAGAGGVGSLGPALAGNARAANLANVLDAVRFGRGLMPAFLAQLGEAELDAVVRYVTEVLAVSP